MSSWTDFTYEISCKFDQQIGLFEPDAPQIGAKITSWLDEAVAFKQLQADEMHPLAPLN